MCHLTPISRVCRLGRGQKTMAENHGDLETLQGNAAASLQEYTGFRCVTLPLSPLTCGSRPSEAPKRQQRRELIHNM